MTKEQLEKTSIENLQLSQRCYNALYRKGYRVVGDLAGKTPEQLQYIRNIGSKTFTELDQKLKSLSFKVNEKGVYEIDTDKLIQENLKDLTDETYMEKLSVILSELVSNAQEIETIDKQILALQQQKVETLEKNTRNYRKIIEDNKTKKYIIK